MAKKTLKEQIAELAKQDNLDFDIEDAEMNLFDGFDDPNSLSGSENEKVDIHDDSHYVAVPKSKLRDNSIHVGAKYDGEIANRDELFGSVGSANVAEDLESEEQEEEEDDDDDGDDEEEEEAEEEGNEEGEEEEDDDEISLSDSEESEEEPQTDLEDEVFKRQKLKSLMKDERKHIISRLSTSAKSDALKGYAALQQQITFDQVVDSRIKLQKLLTLSNQLPLTKEKYQEVGEIQEPNVLKGVKDKIYDLLDQVFQARSLLYLKENITKEVNIGNPKKRTFDEYLKTTSEYDDVLKKYRDNALVKWSHRINSASGSSALNSSKFKLINQDSLKQVQNHLMDMEKLMKRTQLNRKKLQPVGGLILDLEQDDRSLQYSSYIFDDEDFYRVVLNDLIDKKLSQNEKFSSHIALSKQPTKLHKNYDKKASKGRKLNFQIQEPLANFEAPKKTITWNDDQIDEFFAGLLGQKVDMNESDGGDSSPEEEDQEIVLDTGLRLFG